MSEEQDSAYQVAQCDSETGMDNMMMVWNRRCLAEHRDFATWAVRPVPEVPIPFEPGHQRYEAVAVWAGRRRPRQVESWCLVRQSLGTLRLETKSGKEALAVAVETCSRS